MNLGQAVKSCYGKYATFSGRASRSEYWFFHLFFFVIFYALVFTGVFMAGPDDDPGTPYRVIGWLLALFAAGNLLPILAVSVRRIHDTGASGWFILTWIVGIVGVVWACIPGTPGTNKFGPSPFETAADAFK